MPQRVKETEKQRNADIKYSFKNISKYEVL